MAALTRTSNRTFHYVLVFSLVVHGLILAKITGLYNADRVSQIELTMKDISKPFMRHIPRPKNRKIPPPATRARPKAVKARKIHVPKPVPIDKAPATPLTVPVASPIPGAALVPGPGIVSNLTAGPPGLPEFGTQKDYFQMVQYRIEANKKYPAQAKKRLLQGRVTVYFVVNPDGSIIDLKVLKGTRYASLNQAALAAVRESAPFPVPPPSLFTGPLKLKLTILFEMI